MRSDEIRLAARLLMRVLRGESLEVSLNVAGSEFASPRIRAWVYGVCRHYFSLTEQLSHLCATPLIKLDREVLAVLLLGLYQLTHSASKPHAVVSESVEAIKRLHKQSAATLVNAVLRRTDPKFAPTTPSGKHELPMWFIKHMRDAYGEPFVHRHLGCLSGRMPQCLRVNQRKIETKQFHEELQKAGVVFTVLRRAETIHLCSPQATNTIPGFTEGWFCVQDANSQLPVRELELQPGMRVLDACAAPGNKAFQLLEHDIHLTALDISSSRRTWSEAESERLGLPLSIIEGDATTQTWWDGVRYDRILLDAPCSATGTMGRHPDVKLHRQPDQIKPSQACQVKLLKNLWELLNDEGILLYCTCSLLQQENDAVVQQLCVADTSVVVDPLHISPSERPLTIPQKYGVQVFPDPDWGDGFYLAKLRKMKKLA